MKKSILTFFICMWVVFGFSQSLKKNGTVYINHPHIEVIKKAVQGYLTQNKELWSSCYADTAKFWISGMDMKKWVSKKENLDILGYDYKFFKNINIKQLGYPDYIEYEKDNDRVAQAWWTWTGISKKSGKQFIVEFVIFSWFNKDGKIVKEATYGDFSKVFKEEGLNF